MQKEQRNNFIKYVSNPRSYTIKKWLADILQEDYPPHDNIIERIAYALITNEDVKQFGDLISTIYSRAYKRAVLDYKEQAEKLGLKIKLTHKPIQNRDSDQKQQHK